MADARARDQKMEEIVPDPVLTGWVQDSGQSEQVSPTLLGFQENKDSGSSHFILWESSGWLDGKRQKYEKGKIKGLGVIMHLLSQEPSLELPHLFP